jgi:hypothetical protein
MSSDKASAASKRKTESGKPADPSSLDAHPDPSLKWDTADWQRELSAVLKTHFDASLDAGTLVVTGPFPAYRSPATLVSADVRGKWLGVNVTILMVFYPSNGRFRVLRVGRLPGPLRVFSGSCPGSMSDHLNSELPAAIGKALAGSRSVSSDKHWFVRKWEESKRLVQSNKESVLSKLEGKIVSFSKESVFEGLSANLVSASNTTLLVDLCPHLPRGCKIPYLQYDTEKGELELWPPASKNSATKYTVTTTLATMKSKRVDFFVKS